VDVKYQTEGEHYLIGHIFLDYETKNDTTHYYSRASIDRSTSYLADIPRSLPVLLYLNMCFDLYEIHRWILVEKLKGMRNPSRQEISDLYDNELKELYKDLEKIKKDTQKGFNMEGLTKWNQLIAKQLGVNNLEMFGISQEELNSW
jgi:hypothetical protein